MPLDLLAQCLWVLCGFFFAVVVGCCCGGEMVCCCGGGVGCCRGSIGSWWWGFAMVVGVGFTVVALVCGGRGGCGVCGGFFVLGFWS